VASDDEALIVANDSHLGLQAAVYTSSLARAKSDLKTVVLDVAGLT
jgi:acyl-CoA reductase-like NAD-dependent aldehyde dehydrogenase